MAVLRPSDHKQSSPYKLLLQQAGSQAEHTVAEISGPISDKPRTSVPDHLWDDCHLLIQ